MYIYLSLYLSETIYLSISIYLSIYRYISTQPDSFWTLAGQVAPLLLVQEGSLGDVAQAGPAAGLLPLHLKGIPRRVRAARRIL